MGLAGLHYAPYHKFIALGSLVLPGHHVQDDHRGVCGAAYGGSACGEVSSVGRQVFTVLYGTLV